MYDFLIVGAGFFGSTFARIASNYGKSCLVIDKKNYLGGMAADILLEGIITSRHGAHIFHTNNKDVWDFANKYTEIIPFINKPKVISGNKVYSFPINLMTMHQLWGVITPTEAKNKLQKVCIPCENPRNFEEWALSKIGRELYELFIYGYTKKQWMKEPSQLPASIIQRLPIRLTYEENYFCTTYQGMPKNGYTAWCESLLDGTEVQLGVDFNSLKNNWQRIAKHLVYSGPIDLFFDYQLGKLDYNTLMFENKIFDGDFQGNAVINHVDLSVPYLRTVENKLFYQNTLNKHYNNDKTNEKTVISYDIPIPYSEHPEPYYPIRDEKNSSLYQNYCNLRKNLSENVTFGGRLGSYIYMDLDATMAQAIKKAEELCK